jgi:DNA-binding beta-propeller fold protein YncE
MALALLWTAGAQAQSQSFWAFESGHVRPLALSADRSRLYAVNTPDNRLETFAVSDAGLSHLASIPVGLEPVAVCLEPSGARAWVVNHLSDDVSVVDLGVTPPRVVRTLLVGDEPMDCVAASGRMFVSTARRGQNTNIDPAFLTPAVDRTPGRALVWVYDPADLGLALGGTPIEVVGDGSFASGDSIFGDSPRPLAVSPDGSRVYVGIFHSGNRTTAILETVTTGFAAVPGYADRPTVNFEGATRPATGTIVQNDGAGFIDDQGRNYSAIAVFPVGNPNRDIMRMSLPDLDVFEIDAANPSPSGVRVLRSFARVGTILFNMAVNPVSGTLYVSNTDANNRQRFEGPGAFCATQFPPCSSLRGHLHEARLTLIDPASATVTPRHLNKHLAPYTPATDSPSDNDRSLATPLGMAVNSAGTRLYVAAFGSSKIGVFDTAQLVANTFTPSASDHIALSVGGPSGLVLDEPRNRMYVATRFGNAVAVVDTSTFPGTESAIVDFPHDPEPEIVREGRRFLYDARATSSNGEASCSACHVFGNFDSLGWNLGNPDGAVAANPNPFVPDTPQPGPIPLSFHPMKGPMTTQSLRGMANHGPMHWRGDRTGGSIGEDPLSEFEAFMAFRVAFDGLLGRATEATDEEMIAFTNFILEVRYPPNPYRALTNADVTHGWPGNPNGTDLATGRNIFLGGSDPDGPGGAPIDGADGVGGAPFFDNGAGRSCNHCHVLDEAAGFFGSAGLTTFEGEPQHAKVAHLRNIYAKTGFFGMACVSSLPAPPPATACSSPNLGDQVKGFGYLHDGAIGTVQDFVGAPAFAYQGTLQEQNAKRRALAEFILGFPSNLRPIVGQQITLDSTNAGVVGPRIDLLINRALAGDCDLTVKGRFGTSEPREPRGWVMSAFDVFDSDLATEPALTDAALRALAATPGQELTYTCAPPGSGPRIGIDRDADAIRDAQECGDVNADGVPALGDADAMRRALAGLAPLGVAAKCNVIGPLDMADGDLDGVPNDCNVADVAVVRRASNTPALGPGPLQACQRAL